MSDPTLRQRPGGSTSRLSGSMWVPGWGMYDCQNCQLVMSTRGFLDLVGPVDRPVGITVQPCGEHLQTPSEKASWIETWQASQGHPK
jgi:hypothetical protein